MKRKGSLLSVVLCVLIFVATAVLAGNVTIKGTISEEGIMADDGQLYAVVENEKGNEVLELVDEKVEVIGTVEEIGGKKAITVIDYRVIE